jgi:hypothetical protein
MAKKEVRSTLGVGHFVVLRIDHGEDHGSGYRHAIGFDRKGGFHPPPVGHGNTPREAAKDLADQLRELARLIEEVEGST